MTITDGVGEGVLYNLGLGILINFATPCVNRVYISLLEAFHHHAAALNKNGSLKKNKSKPVSLLCTADGLYTGRFLY